MSVNNGLSLAANNYTTMRATSLSKDKDKKRRTNNLATNGDRSTSKDNNLNGIISVNSFSNMNGQNFNSTMPQKKNSANDDYKDYTQTYPISKIPKIGNSHNSQTDKIYNGEKGNLLGSKNTENIYKEHTRIDKENLKIAKTADRHMFKINKVKGRNAYDNNRGINVKNLDDAIITNAIYQESVRNQKTRSKSNKKTYGSKI